MYVYIYLLKCVLNCSIVPVFNLFAIKAVVIGIDDQRDTENKITNRGTIVFV